MASGGDQSQKTQQPTPRKIADAAKEGDVLMSRELATALMVLVGAIWLVSAGGWLAKAAEHLLEKALRISVADVSDFSPGSALAHEIGNMLVPVAILFAGTWAAAIGGTAALGSLGWRAKAFQFKGNRLDPLAGLKRMFGTHGLIELAKALAKVAVLGGIGYAVLTGHVQDALKLAALDAQAASALAGNALGNTLLALACGLVAIALIDVPAQWFQRNRRLMMSFEEVKREHRENDGAPEIKGQQRARQREILSGSARRSIGEATVVLTNPTHFAVALRYRPGIDAAPVVVARGRGETALAIRSLAKQASVPLLEYPQLTRALYFSVRAGKVIPEELFVAVALVLAFVFRLDQAASNHAPPPAVDVPATHHFDADGRRSARPA